MGIFRFFTRRFSRKPPEKSSPPAPSAAMPKPKQVAVSAHPGAAQTIPAQLIPITTRLLKRLFPIRNLPPDELEAFATGRSAQAAPAGTVLFRAGEPAEAVHYLLAGQIRMEVAEAMDYEVAANTSLARFPLCASRSHYKATATALTEVQYLCVSRRVMSYSSDLEATGEYGNDPLRRMLEAADLPEEVRHSRLFQEFCEQFRADEPCFPTLPDIAVRLREAVERDSSMREISHIVEMDPGIAARILSVANSPLYFSSHRIETCRDAVSRLGLVAVRNLVTAISLRNLFRARDPGIARLLLEDWERSLYRSTLCHLLAARASSLLPEQALLAGLLCDIGVVPFLHFADRLSPEYRQAGEIESVLPHVRGPLGAFLLEKWDVPDEFVELPLLAERWLHDAGETLTLADIVILAKLHMYIGTPRQAHLPRINSIPAYSKLPDGRLSPHQSLQILHEAKDRIREAVRIMCA